MGAIERLINFFLLTSSYRLIAVSDSFIIIFDEKKPFRHLFTTHHQHLIIASNDLHHSILSLPASATPPIDSFLNNPHRNNNSDDHDEVWIMGKDFSFFLPKHSQDVSQERERNCWMVMLFMCALLANDDFDQATGDELWSQTKSKSRERRIVKFNDWSI